MSCPSPPIDQIMTSADIPLPHAPRQIRNLDQMLRTPDTPWSPWAGFDQADKLPAAATPTGEADCRSRAISPATSPCTSEATEHGETSFGPPPPGLVSILFQIEAEEAEKGRSVRILNRPDWFKPGVTIRKARKARKTQ